MRGTHVRPFSGEEDMRIPNTISRIAFAGAIALAVPAVYAQSGTGMPSSTNPSTNPTSGAAAPGGNASTGGPAGTMRSGANPTLSQEDRTYFGKLAQANQAEIAAGEVAQSKSTNPEVVKFAKQMVDDHGMALRKVTDLGKSKGLEVPSQPDDDHQKALEKLKSLSGKDFDKKYAEKSGVDDHEDTLKLLKDIQSKSKDADLKALAAKLQPTVEEHLKMAKTMKKSVK